MTTFTLSLVVATALTTQLVSLGEAAGAAVEAPRAANPLEKAMRSRDEWRRSRIPVLINDFGEKGHFRKANAALGPAEPGENRVVFFGDSITSGWPLDQFFVGRPYINRGIGGQTTSQALVRFRQDVVELKPLVVVILLGTNDLAGNTGPITLEDIEKNLASIAELARLHKIGVVLSSVTPVHNYTPLSDITFPLRPPAQILELNRWLKRYAADSGATYLDYFSALVDDKGMLKKELAPDGLHPNHAGYELMAPLAAVAIQRALANAAAGH
ncbi:MAG TPA: SGNH/GDSL hydrolase family protein [Polyangia bacterium]|jgi:lysophospholipase L1-like esterase